MTAAADYKMSFSTGGLFLNESVELARLHQEGEAWTQTRDRALAEGATLLPKATSNFRTLREISHRVSCLSETERLYLTQQADRSEQQALLWLATCRAYRFVREFAIEVLQERLASFRPDLSFEAFDLFFDEKSAWNPALAKISNSTRLKLRQVLFRIMREANITDGENQIRTALLTTRLEAMITQENPGDLSVFPGLIR